MTMLGSGAAIASLAVTAKALILFSRVALSAMFASRHFQKDDEWMSWSALTHILTMSAYIIGPLAYEAGGKAAKNYYSLATNTASDSPLLNSLIHGINECRRSSWFKSIAGGFLGMCTHYICASALTMLTLAEEERTAVFMAPVTDDVSSLARTAGKFLMTATVTLPIAALTSQAAQGAYNYASRFVAREVLGHRHAL